MSLSMLQLLTARSIAPINPVLLHSHPLLRALFLSICIGASGCTIEVNSTDDRPDAAPGDGNCADSLGFCTLRAAITEAHESVGTFRIVIPAGTYPLTLPARDPNGGALKILSNMQLQGAGSDLTIIDAGYRHGVMQVEGGTDVALNYLQITGGDNQAGGGLRVNNGNVSLYDVHIHNNRATTGGAGLYVLAGRCRRRSGRIHRQLRRRCLRRWRLESGAIGAAAIPVCEQ